MRRVVDTNKSWGIQACRISLGQPLSHRGSWKCLSLKRRHYTAGAAANVLGQSHISRRASLLYLHGSVSVVSWFLPTCLCPSLGDAASLYVSLSLFSVSHWPSYVSVSVPHELSIHPKPAARSAFSVSFPAAALLSMTGDSQRQRHKRKETPGGRTNATQPKRLTETGDSAAQARQR